MFIVTSLLESVIYYLFLCCYYPLYLFGLFVIKLKIKCNKLKQKTGWHLIYHGIMKPLSKKSKVADVGLISTDEELDFLTHRSPGYLERMTFWTAKELAKLAVGRQSIELISDSQLAFVLMNTVFAHSLVWDSNRSVYVLDLTDMNNFTLFEGFYWEAKRVNLNPDTLAITIVMRNGEKYHSDCSHHDKPEYNLAKLHLQICLSYYAPGMSHNYVHFVFPSAICLAAKSILTENSVLYQLLSPHFRFMERLNYQALRVCHASSNARTPADRFFFFWKPFPITKEQFTSSMEKKLKDYYFASQQQKNCRYPERQYSELNGKTSNGVQFETMTSMSADGQKSIFPPSYVNNKSLRKIPYLAFLTEYYQVIEEFVREIEPHLNRQEWNEVSKEVSQYVPDFDKVDMVEAITTFIHMVAVVHSADHQSYLDYFATKYGCMSIRIPFEPFSDKSFWKDVQVETGIPADEIKKNPLKLVLQRDIMRMRCFCNVFVDFIPSPNVDLTLLKINYKFQNSYDEIAARNFVSRLRSLDGNLKSISYKFPKAKEDMRPFGMQLVQLEHFVQSSCY